MKIIAVKKCENCYKFNDTIYDSEDLPEKIMNALNYKEYVIFLMLYLENKKTEDIAKYFSVTRERVRQLQEKIYRKLGIKIPNLTIEEITHAVSVNPEKFIGVTQKTTWVVASDDALRENYVNNKMHTATANSRVFCPQRTEIVIETPQVCDDNRPIDVLNLSVRPYNCLIAAGYKTVADVVNAKNDDLMQIINLGRKSFHEILESLSLLGYKKN